VFKKEYENESLGINIVTFLEINAMFCWTITTRNCIDAGLCAVIA